MKIDYYNAISGLIIFKDRHSFILNKKNKKVLNYLKTFELIDEFESCQIPNAARIIEATGLARNKINPIWYQSYLDIKATLESKAMPIHDCVHTNYIRRHEVDTFSNRNDGKEEVKREQALTFLG